MSDHEDFASLAALLESDDDMIENENAATKSEKSENNIQSSDDDIDEDELDKLAALATAEDHNEDRIDSANSQPNQRLTQDDMDTSADKLECIEDAKSPQETSEEDDVERELRLMKEKIALLEAQLKNKKSKGDKQVEEDKKAVNTQSNGTEKSLALTSMKSKSSTQSSSSGLKKSASSSSKTPISSNQSKSPAHSKNSADSSSKTRTSNTAPPKQKVRLLEENIFDIVGAITGESSVKKSNTVGSTSKKLDTKFQSYSRGSSSSFSNKNQEKRRTGSQPSGVSQPTKKDLFGEDSDSDWSDMEGEKPFLSEEGRELKKIMKKGQRIAHNPKIEPPQVPQRVKDSKPTAPVIKEETSTNQSSAFAPSGRLKRKEEDEETTELFTGLKIIKPLISHEMMQYRMNGRKHIRMSTLYRRLNTADTETDWVTIGVIVSKSDPKMSSKGNQYSIWTLSDLDDCDKIVSFFLFGKTHQAHWKTPKGTVIGILNPSAMPNAEKYQKKNSDEVSITVQDPKQAMIIGTSKEVGTCKGRSFKTGKSCSNFINVSRGEFCTYHIQAQYKKVSAKRGDLQSGFTGVTPKSFEKKLFGSKGNSTVYYGGHTYTTSTAPERKSKKPGGGLSLTNLQQHQLKTNKDGKRTTLHLHKLMPEDEKMLAEIEKAKTKPLSEKEELFHDMLAMPTVGAMNLVKHIAKKENCSVGSSKPAVKYVQSITAKDLLKSHEEEMKRKIMKRKGETPSAIGSEPKLPVLGRGIHAGKDVDIDLDDMRGPTLFAPTGLNPHTNSKKVEMLKAKAIAKIQMKGGITKEDPNAVRKNAPEVRERVKKRLVESEQADTEESDSHPPKKRSRLLGNLDLEDPEVQKLLKRNSKHAGQLSKEEQERQEQYFEVLEKKEQMEEKMANTKEVKVRAWSCQQCKYTAYKSLDSCREQGHKLMQHDAKKRFFKCTSCNYRTTSLDKLPKEHCKKCGEFKWVRASMLKEKNVKLANEELLLRGEERKHVNS